MVELRTVRTSHSTGWIESTLPSCATLTNIAWIGLGNAEGESREPSEALEQTALKTTKPRPTIVPEQVPLAAETSRASGSFRRKWRSLERSSQLVTYPGRQPGPLWSHSLASSSPETDPVCRFHTERRPAACAVAVAAPFLQPPRIKCLKHLSHQIIGKGRLYINERG